MSPALIASLMNAGLATLEAIRAAQTEHPDIAVGVDLKKRLRAEITLLSAQLDRDIADELEKRAGK